MALLSFGAVVISAGATPVNLADALFPNRASGVPVPLSSVTLQADDDNSGKIYIFFKSDGTDQRGTKTGLAFMLGQPYFADVAETIQGPLDRVTYGFDSVPGGIDLQNIWVQSDVDGDSVIVSGTRG